MSWAEVKKINSDYANEPLNFNNYINDISTFKEDSYVLDVQNQGLWRDLISQSLTLFGHTVIHNTVYNRFTDADVDFMLRNNGRVGQTFNSFYHTASFVSGNIDVVLSAITTKSYNELEIKFQNGINRYISDMTSGSLAGQWLGNVFSIDALKSKTDMASILSDTTLWNDTIMTNESLRYVVCLSAAAINWFSSTNSSAFLSFIAEVCNSTQATMDLFNALDGNDKLAAFMNTENVVSIMASKKESMEAVCYMESPFAAMINSETAMNIVSASETSVNVIIEGMTNVANSEVVLSGIKENLTSIEESLPNIANTDIVISDVADVKENIADVVASLQKVTSQTDILIENIDALLASEVAITAICSSETAIVAIVKASSSITLGFWISVNKSLKCVCSIYNIVTTSSKFSKTGGPYNDSTSRLDEYGNIANTIILVAPGNSYHDSSSSVCINGINVGALRITYVPKDVTVDNVGAIAVPTATFVATGGNSYSAVVLYTAL